MKAIFWFLLSSLLATIFFFLIKEYIVHDSWWLLAVIVILDLSFIYIYRELLLEVPAGPAFYLLNGIAVLFGLMLAAYNQHPFTGRELSGSVLIMAGIFVLVGPLSGTGGTSG